MNVGELTATFDVNAAGADRGIAAAEASMLRLQAEAEEIGNHIRDSMDETISAIHPDILIDADAEPADRAVADIVARLAAIRDARIGIDVPVEQARTELDSIREACDQLSADHPNIEVSVAAERALFSLDLLDTGIDRIEDVHIQIQATVEAQEAEVDLADLWADARRIAELSPDIEVTVDAARAEAELAAIDEEARHVGDLDPHIDVHADSSEVDQAGRDVSGLTDALSSAGSGAASFGGQFAMGAAAVGAGVPVIAGVVAALQAILPAAGAAATGLLMVASAGAAIKIGTSGIGGAISAAFAPVAAGAGAAAGGANKAADAQRALRDATQQAADANTKAAEQVGKAQQTLVLDEQAVTDAQVQGARNVASAERTLADAEKASEQAQLDLNAARKQAAMDLQDLSNQLTDASLSQRGDVLAVQQAQQGLALVIADPTASQAQRAQAQLTFDEAKQRLSEQTLAYQRLQDQQASASQAGVEGSQVVISAQAKLAAAVRTVGDDQQSVADTQVTAQKSVADAVRKVQDQVQALQDAQTQQARTAAQGAEQVQKAMEALGAGAGGAAGGGVNALAAALAKLSPSARAFVEEIIALKPALTSMKLDVQQALFQGLDTTLGRLAAVSLPVLRQGLIGSATELNGMAKGVANAADGLAESGALGRALASANKGLGNLAGIPGQVVTGLGQIAAAAGPAFDKITGGAGKLADTISSKLSAAFSSGGMEKAINIALGLLDQLGTFVSNVGKIIGDVLSAAGQTGGGFIGTLVKISDAMAKAFATPAVQNGLSALFGVMGTLASTVAPLLGQALGVIGPVLSALGPPVQILIGALGNALGPIIKALGPVLLAAAQAVGQLIIAASPLLGLIGTLASALLPALTPILSAAGQIFQQLAPFVQAVSDALSAALGPILAVLPSLIQPFMTILTTLVGTILPILTQLIVSLPLVSLGQSFAQIAVALVPVLTQLASLVVQYLPMMLPILIPLITAVAKLADIFASELAQNIQSIVVPALQMIADLLSGNFSGAIRDAKAVLSGLVDTVVREFTQLPGQILSVFSGLESSLETAGNKIIGGLVKGIKDKVGDVTGAIGGVLTSARNLLPFSPAKEGPFSGSGWSLYSGQSISHALADGILGGQPRVKAATQSLMMTAHGALGGAGGQFAMAGGAGGAAGGGFHIQHYHEAANGNARGTAEELMWLGKGRG